MFRSHKSEDRDEKAKENDCLERLYLYKLSRDYNLETFNCKLNGYEFEPLTYTFFSVAYRMLPEVRIKELNQDCGEGPFLVFIRDKSIYEYYSLVNLVHELDPKCALEYGYKEEYLRNNIRYIDVFDAYGGYGYFDFALKKLNNKMKYPGKMMLEFDTYFENHGSLLYHVAQLIQYYKKSVEQIKEILKNTQIKEAQAA